MQMSMAWPIYLYSFTLTGCVVCHKKGMDIYPIPFFNLLPGMKY